MLADTSRPTQAGAKSPRFLLALIREPACGMGLTNSHNNMEQCTSLQLAQVNEVKIIYRTKASAPRPLIRNAADAFQVLQPFFDECMDTHEEFWVILLDRANRAKSVYKVSQGGVTGTTCDPRLVFACALKCLASNIILAHNHPSGQLRPSEEDIRLTRKLVEGARFLDLTIFDHLILSREGYYSFADNTLI